MRAAARTIIDSLVERAPARLREVAFASACRLHLVRLDRTPADRAQLRTLLGLVHRASRTRFGRDHDFSRVRSAEDFRRLIPLRTPAALARDHAEADPAALRASRRQALRTAFALLHAADPKLPLAAGRILSLEDRWTASHWPLLLRPGLRAPADVPVACAVGPAARLGPCFDHSGKPFDPPALLRLRTGAEGEAEANPAPRSRLALDLLALPEATVAVEDHRIGGLRLLVDHGVYFEFVPAGQEAPRLSLGEVRTGEVYELAVTSPGGWWACRSGLFVTFDTLTFPLVRLVPAPAKMGAPAERPADQPATSPACHPRSGGTRAALPETSAHSPWSVPADRG